MKILGSDYDGTLSYEDVTPEKCEIIHRWRSEGNVFGIVSGRNSQYLQTLLAKHPSLELDFFACCNGGVILNAEGKVLHETLCHDVDPMKLTTELLKWGCPFVHMNSHTYRCIVTSFENKSIYVDDSDVVLFDYVEEWGAFHQVSVQLKTIEDANRIVALVNASYSGKLNPLRNGGCVDIVPCGVNKAQGLYRVMEIFGGKYEDVIAVGDNINDFDMIKEFRSYAMKHAPDEVKAVANAITTGVDLLILTELQNLK